MNNPRLWAVPLVILHAFFVGVWGYIFFFSEGYLPTWMAYLAIWTVIGIQFTWGFTIGLMVGPARATRAQLWLSAITAVLPLYFVGIYCLLLLVYGEMHIAFVLLMFFTMAVIFACETFCGVLLGATAYIKIRSLGRSSEE